jgi:hypothetical protein
VIREHKIDLAIHLNAKLSLPGLSFDSTAIPLLSPVLAPIKQSSCASFLSPSYQSHSWLSSLSLNECIIKTKFTHCCLVLTFVFSPVPIMFSLQCRLAFVFGHIVSRSYFTSQEIVVISCSLLKQHLCTIFSLHLIFIIHSIATDKISIACSCYGISEVSSTFPSSSMSTSPSANLTVEVLRQESFSCSISPAPLSATFIITEL